MMMSVQIALFLVIAKLTRVHNIDLTNAGSNSSTSGERNACIHTRQIALLSLHVMRFDVVTYLNRKLKTVPMPF